MTNILIWAVVGLVLGGIASRFSRPGARSSGTESGRRSGIWLNLLAGVIGAVGAGLLVAPRLGTPTANEGLFSVSPLLVSALGALAVLLLINVVFRGDPG